MLVLSRKIGERVLVPHCALVVTVLDRSGSSAVVYFGGNAEDVSQSLAQLAVAFPDRALYLMHYRGYGGHEQCAESGRGFTRSG